MCSVWVNQEISKPLASKNIGFLYCYGRWTFEVMNSKTELISHITNISESYCNINKVETHETLESPHNRSFIILVSCGFMLMLSIKTRQNQSAITQENAINLNLWTCFFSIFKHKFLQYQQRIISTKKMLVVDVLWDEAGQSLPVFRRLETRRNMEEDGTSFLKLLWNDLE